MAIVPLTAYSLPSGRYCAQGNVLAQQKQCCRTVAAATARRSAAVAQALALLMAPHCLLTCLLPSHYSVEVNVAWRAATAVAPAAAAAWLGAY